MSDYVSMPPAWLRLCFPVLAVAFFFGLITVFHGQDSFVRPRYSDVQESIYSAKKNALRVRTDDNRQEFLSILGDVESALNAARQSLGQSRRQQVLEKLQRIQPEAQKALVDAGTQQSKSVRKIKSVITKKADVAAIDKAIVRKLEPGEKPRSSLATKINPLRWFGRNRQYTKVVERASAPPKPDLWKKTSDQPKMVRVPPIPLNLPSVVTWSPPPVLINTLVPEKQFQPSRPPAPPSSIPTPTPGVRKIKKPQKPHSFISIQQRSASRRISERTRDGDYRLPSGRISKTAIPSTLTKKIKKPERKSTKVWDFGPKNNETSHPEQKTPVVEWISPSRLEPVQKPVVPERLKEAIKSSSGVFDKTKLLGNPTRRIQSRRIFPRISKSYNSAELGLIPSEKETPVKMRKPSSGDFVRPDPIKDVSPEKEIPENRIEKPIKKPAVVIEPRKFATPDPIEEVLLPKEVIEGPNGKTPTKKPDTVVGSALSKLVIVDTRPEQKKQPLLASAVNTIKVPRPVSVPSDPLMIEDILSKGTSTSAESVLILPTLEEAANLTEAMRREEEILNERLKGIDKLLSDNAGVLSEAEALLKELEQLEAEQKASNRKEKSKLPSRLRFRKPSRPIPTSKVELPSKSDEPKDKQLRTNPLETEDTKQDFPAVSVPSKKKWGTTRRPGVRR